MTQTLYPETSGPANEAEDGAPHVSAPCHGTPRMPEVQLDLTPKPMDLFTGNHLGRKKPRGLLTMGAMLLVPAVLGGTGVALFNARGSNSEAKPAQLVEERDQARKDEAQVKKQLDQVVAERRALERERDEALAGEKAARSSEQNTKAVLAFLQDKLLLATGNPTSWDNNGLGEEATLREAVDAADAKVAGAFADRPLVEASVRQILGAAYLDLGEAERAVQQYQRALALREAELGPDDPATGDCRNQLAVAYRRARRHDDASRLFDVHPGSGKPRDDNDR